MTYMGIVYKYDDPQNLVVSNPKLFIGEFEDEADAKTKKRKRIGGQEIDANILICLIVFMIQMAFLSYMFMEFLNRSIDMGGLTVNVTRLISAFSLHA